MFIVRRQDCIKENKNKIKSFWGWRLSEYKSNEPHQNITASRKKKGNIEQFFKKEKQSGHWYFNIKI